MLALYKLDNWHAAVALLGDYAVLSFAIYLPFGLQSAQLFWPAYALISLPLIGTRQRALATLLHESAHRTLARSPRWNFIAGTFLSGYLVLQGWSTYHSSHVRGHHPHLGIRGLDPDFDAHVDGGVYCRQGRLAFLWRNVVGPFFLTRTPHKLRDLVTNRLWSRKEPRLESVARFAWLGIVFGTLAALGFAHELLLFWLVPLLTTFPVVNWWIELMEHYPIVQGARSDLETTRNRWTGPLGRVLFGVHNEHLHQAHHLWVRVPFWKLPHAHEILMADPDYRASQLRSVGLLRPTLPGIPSILDAILPGDREEAA